MQTQQRRLAGRGIRGTTGTTEGMAGRTPAMSWTAIAEETVSGSSRVGGDRGEAEATVVPEAAEADVVPEEAETEAANSNVSRRESAYLYRV